MVVTAIKRWIEGWLRFAWLWFLYIVSSENSGLQYEYDCAENRDYLHFPEKRVISGRDVYLQTVLTNSSVKPVPKKESKRPKESSVNHIVQRFESNACSTPELPVKVQIFNKAKGSATQKRSSHRGPNSASTSSGKITPILCKRSEILGHSEDDNEDPIVESTAPCDATDNLWEELVARYAAEETAKECDALKTRLGPRLGSMERSDSVKSEEDIARELDGKLQKYLSRLDNDDISTELHSEVAEATELDLHNITNIPTICDYENERNKLLIMIEDDSSDVTEEKGSSDSSAGKQDNSEFGSLLKSYETELNLADVSELSDNLNHNDDFQSVSTTLVDKHAEDGAQLDDLNVNVDSPILMSDQQPLSTIPLSEENMHSVDEDFAMLCGTLDGEAERDFNKIIACYIHTSNLDDDQSIINISKLENKEDYISEDIECPADPSVKDESSQKVMDFDQNFTVNESENNMDNENILAKSAQYLEVENVAAPITVDVFDIPIKPECNKDTAGLSENNITEKIATDLLHDPVSQTTVDLQAEIVDILPEHNLQADGTVCQEDTSHGEAARLLEVIECDISKPVDHTSTELNDSLTYIPEEKIQVDSINNDKFKKENNYVAVQKVDTFDEGASSQTFDHKKEAFDFDEHVGEEFLEEKCIPVLDKCDNDDVSNMTEDDLSRQIEMILKGLIQIEHDYSAKNPEQRLADKFSIDSIDDNVDELSIPSCSDDEFAEIVIDSQLLMELKMTKARCSSPLSLPSVSISEENASFDGSNANIFDNQSAEENYRKNSKFSLEDIPEENEFDEELPSEDGACVDDATGNADIISEIKNNSSHDLPCGANEKNTSSQSDIPEYLDDVKDLLIPRARRKKAKKFKELEDILKVDETKAIKTPPAEDSGMEDLYTMEVDDQILDAGACSTVQIPELELRDDEKDTDSLANFTEEEKKELEEIKLDQAQFRAAQRKEIEKYLSLPYTLTEQEQTELEEILAEEEADKVISAASEARLLAFLTDVRNRMGHYSDEEDNAEDFDNYLKLPMSLTKDEEELLSTDGPELSRNDFSSDDEYKKYVKNKYLQELEEDRLKVEEEYEHDYEEYSDNDYSFDSSEMQEYGDNEDDSFYKDQAVNTDAASAPEKVKKNKLKNYIAKIGSKSSKSPKPDKYLGATSSEPKDNSDSSSSQSNFFRCGSLGKRKKKAIIEDDFVDENNHNLDCQYLATCTGNSSNVDAINERPSSLAEGVEDKRSLDFCEFDQFEQLQHSSTQSKEVPEIDFPSPTSAHGTGDSDTFNSSGKVQLNSELVVNPGESEAMDKSKKDNISSPTNFVIFPLKSVENFPVKDIYSYQSHRIMLNNEHDPNPKIDHIMSTGKGLRKNTGSEVDGIKSPMLDEFEKMEQEVEEAEKKIMTNGVDKKRKDGEKKKKKKKRKTDGEKENKKSAIQSRDAIYEKHVGPRIRSFDTAKMKSKFNKPKESTQVSSECRICGKPVFQMEKIVAEKASWHKNCFRCTECNKQMTAETYQSHEGTLYCKPHFKELFRPKAVVQDEADERKDRLLRRPRMIILESQPDILPDDVVRASSKPDYGLDELQSLNMRQRFSMFEKSDKEDETPKLEQISIQRSQSLMSKAKFYEGEENSGELEFDEEDEDEDMDEDESNDIVNGEINGVVKSRKKKERPMSFSGIGDLKNAWEQKHRREEMTVARKEEVGRFRQLLCAGKNNALKEMFESGNFENEDDEQKEKLAIEVTHGAKSLRERFEKGQPFVLEEDDERNGDSENSNEVDEIFKGAETAKNARNVFKEIDSVVSKEGAPVMRSKSFAHQPREKRYSQDVSFLALQISSPSTAEVIKANEKLDDFQVDTTDLASRFKFFSTYEKRLEHEKQTPNRAFRITPPREGADYQGNTADDIEVGRDPNLIKCTDNLEDDVDCGNTKNILQYFRKMEMDDQPTEDNGPRPLKSFTPPPGANGEGYDGESGDGDEDYSDDDYSDSDSDEEEEEQKPQYKDEILEMLAQSSQSAKKAAHLRAKFEKYDAQTDRQNSEDPENEEYRPSLDTARNLKAMFENKAVEESRPVQRNPSSAKVNRFV